MSWEVAVRERLLADLAVAGLAGRHPEDDGLSIDWGTLRQDAPRPGIVLKLAGDPRPQTHDGFDSIRPSRVRAAISAETRGAVVALREAAIAALVPAGEFSGVWFDRARIELVIDTGGPSVTGFVHADSIDFIFWHKG